MSVLILITGLSGAGKSTALHTFADAGYYVVDNLPVSLTPNILFFAEKHSKYSRGCALLLDIESLVDSADFLSILELLKKSVERLEIVFLDASDQVLVKRYSETRRPHPIFDSSQDSSLIDAIARERARLQPLKERANLVLDTSTYTVHTLRRAIEDFSVSVTQEPSRQLRLLITSFGFKYGSPFDCDVMMDVRFLPNPYFEKDLKEKTGLDQEVSTFVLNSQVSKDFLSRYSDLINFLLPHYIQEGKSYLKIGIGCTGGKHRSVAIAEELRRLLSSKDILISVNHRDYLL